MPRAEIRYSKDGSQLLCLKCYGSQAAASSNKKRIVATDEDLELLSEPAPPTSAAIGTSASKRVTAVHGEPVEKAKRGTYLCSNCRYKFTRDKDTRIYPRCPYCGKAALMEVTDVSVKDLIGR